MTTNVRKSACVHVGPRFKLTVLLLLLLLLLQTKMTLSDQRRSSGTFAIVVIWLLEKCWISSPLANHAG